MPKKLKCYDIQDIYKKIHKKDRIVDEKTFGAVVKAYFRNTVDDLFEYSEAYLPYGWGYLRCQVSDLTPYYDVKTGEVHGWIPKWTYKNNKPTKIVKVFWYKCTLSANPLRFFRLHHSSYVRQKKAEMYQTGKLNSLFTKKD